MPEHPNLPPNHELRQVRGWYEGASADPSTSIGRETNQIVGRSVDFFVDVLERLLPSAEFVDGSYATTCVTCKSQSGGRLLAELAPGLIQQTGCNGGGATAALAWGAQAADEARAALARL